MCKNVKFFVIAVLIFCVNCVVSADVALANKHDGASVVETSSTSSETNTAGNATSASTSIGHVEHHDASEFDIVKNGVALIEDNSTLSKKIISLRGKWEYYPEENFHEIDFEQKSDYVDVPVGFIQLINLRSKVNRHKTATYRLVIKGLNPYKEYAFFSRENPSVAADFYCNNKLIANYGVCSQIQDEQKSLNYPVFFSCFATEEGEIELIVNVSSYDSLLKGINAPIMFAEYKCVEKYFKQIVIIDYALLGALLFCCIVNFSVFFGNRNAKPNLYFGLLFICLIFLIIIFNCNTFGWIFNIESTKLSLWLKYMFTWLSPLLFNHLCLLDTQFTERHRRQWLGINYECVILAILLTYAPESFFVYLVPFAIFNNVVYFVYALFRCAYSFVNKNIKLGIYLILYMLVAFGVFVDIVFIEFVLESVITVTEVCIALLIIFDVFYMAILQNNIFKHAKQNLINMNESLSVSRKFFNLEIFNLIGKTAESVKVGNYKKLNTTVMYFHLEAIDFNYDNKTNSRELFESCNRFSKHILKTIKNERGVICNNFGNEIIVIFTKANNALSCASKILRIVKSYNANSSRLREPAIMCSGAINTGEVILGAVGNYERIECTMIGEGIEITKKMIELSLKYGLAIITSENTLKVIEDDFGCEVNLITDKLVEHDDNIVKIYRCTDVSVE